MFKNLLVIFLLLFNFSVYGEDNLLTLKQQLDRLQRDVNDLSKLTFQRDNDDNNISNNSSKENSVNITAFDLRIYDIEKDIKTLNSNFEELVFQVDEIKSAFEELSIGFEELSIRIDTALINKVENTKTQEISSAKINNKEDTENTLGTLKINSEDLSEDNTEEVNNKLGSDTQNLKPEEQFQLAFDLLRSQKFDQAKKALKKFIADNTDNELAGSAHYWLGEIHLLKKDYREAALVFAEGYQKYPSSIKAPENLYKLAEALSKIDKKNEACNTLEKFLKEYIDHKLVVKINSKISELECK